MRRSLLRRSELYDFCERLWMIDGQIGKNLTIDADLFLVETGNQFRIRDLVEACGCVDPCDPQRSVFTLLGSAMTICVLTGLVDVMFRDGMDFASRTPVTLGARQELLPPQVRCDLIL